MSVSNKNESFDNLPNFPAESLIYTISHTDYTFYWTQVCETIAKDGFEEIEVRYSGLKDLSMLFTDFLITR